MDERAGVLEAASDAAVIGASARHPERFELVFNRHFAAVHRYLARRAGREAADDLASLCFTVAFERRRSFDPRFADARPWLYGIATNLLREHWRGEQRRVSTEAELSAGRAPADSGEDEGDADLARALATLEPKQRDVLLLYALGELTYDEIAGALGVPVGTVRSRLARARAAVRAALATAPVEREKT